MDGSFHVTQTKPHRSAVDEYAPPALVGDVELAVVPQFDDALQKSSFEFAAILGTSLSHLPPRDLPGGPLQLEVDVDAGVLGAAPEGDLLAPHEVSDEPPPQHGQRLVVEVGRGVAPHLVHQTLPLGHLSLQVPER